jgi:hypothetical protein
LGVATAATAALAADDRSSAVGSRYTSQTGPCGR